jgi:hypothetical protein
MKITLQTFLPVAVAVFAISTATGCYVRKETVREPTASTTVERSTTSDTVPQEEIHRRTTTVEHY